MKDKRLIVGLVVAVAVILAFVFIIKPGGTKKGVKKVGTGQAAKPAAAKTATPAKRTFSKDMGGLTVKVLSSKNRELALKGKAFRVIDAKSSTYVTSLVSGRMAELSPGNYDIEIDTIPQKIFKGITVSKGKETVENLSAIMGALNVKALNSKQKPGSNPVKILYPASNILVLNTLTNRPVELIAGIYDVEIGTMPIQSRKNVRVDSGKDTVLDLGCTSGALIVKVQDTDKKDVKCIVKIRRPADNEHLTSIQANRSTDLVPGTYNIEAMLSPVQTKDGIEIKVGEERIVEFVAQNPTSQPPASRVSTPTGINTSVKR